MLMSDLTIGQIAKITKDNTTDGYNEYQDAIVIKVSGNRALGDVYVINGPGRGYSFGPHFHSNYEVELIDIKEIPSYSELLQRCLS